MRKVHLVLSGPIRPSLSYILQNVKRVKEFFGDLTTHLVYWDTGSEQDAKELSDAFDHVYSLEEPTVEDIFKRVSGRTIQQMENKTLEHWTIGIYKMFYGLRCFVEQNTVIQPKDIVIRMRTDLWLESVKNGNRLLDSIQKTAYAFCPRESGWRSCDWFSISTYNVFCKVWYYATDSEYNAAIKKTHCAETMVTDKLKGWKLNKVDINSFIKIAICRDYTDGVPRLDYRHD